MEIDGGHLDIFKVLFYALVLNGSGWFTHKKGFFFFKCPHILLLQNFHAVQYKFLEMSLSRGNPTARRSQL